VVGGAAAKTVSETGNASEPVALITGSSSGIGEVFARKLSSRGYRVILVARRKERLEKLALELQNAEILPADLTIDSGLRAVENRITAEPKLEFLVNNAGFGVQGGFFSGDVEPQDRMHRLHIIAIERLTHAALKGMADRRAGSIINVSSVSGFLQAPNSVSYSATKAWINSFTEGLYLEMKSTCSPIRIQLLCPGFTYTEFHDKPGMNRDLIPRGLWMSAEDVVDASLRGLEKGRWMVIPGWRYRLFVGLYPLLPGFARHSLAIWYGRVGKKPPAKHVDGHTHSTPVRISVKLRISLIGRFRLLPF
jgi:short-subunit dehydrogenase